MLALLSLFTAVIAGYWTLIEPGRVRALAQQYLSDLVGARVEIGRAALSLFEGLRLENVTIDIDSPGSPQSRIFSARTVVARTSAAAVLAGRFQTARIVVLYPRIHLCENLDVPGSERWNYLRLFREPRSSRKLIGYAGPPVLPRIVVRAGVIEYARIHQGRYSVAGNLALDGQLTPVPSGTESVVPPGCYRFELSGRVPGQTAGPRLSGILELSGPAVRANLQNLELTPAIRAMLPADVQDWCAAHQVAGRLRLPRLEYVAPTDSAPEDFRVEVQLDSVRMAIPAEELLGSEDYLAQRRVRPGIPVGRLADLGLVSRIDLLERTMPPRPIALTGVSGRLIFTPRRITLSGIRGKIENKSVCIDGVVHGYKLGAAASVRLVANNLTIPPFVPYLSSIPEPVRKIYEDFVPSGQLSLGLQLTRPRDGDRLSVVGVVEVHDATFLFREFPYSLRRVTGRLLIGPDPVTSLSRIELHNLRGYGPQGSPNADSFVVVNGSIVLVPRGIQLSIDLAGSDFRLDSQLRSVLPPDARHIIGMFDRRLAPGESDPSAARPHDVVPVELAGRFEAHIRRPPGPKKHLAISVDLDIQHAEGAFSAFPYPLRNVTGRISFRPGYTEVHALTCKSGAAKIRVEGRINHPRGGLVEPQLNVTAQNIPIDEHLLGALPPTQRRWLEQFAPKGLLDIEGRLFLPPGASSTAQTDFDLEVQFRQGSLWPVGQVPALEDVAARLHMTRTSLVVENLQARRGPGRLAGCATIRWQDDLPQFTLAADLEGVPLDRILYSIAPRQAQEAWDSLAPQGTVDLSVSWQSSPARPEGAALSDTPTAGLSIRIRPRELTIVPPAFAWPMRFTQGEIEVRSGRTLLRGVTLRHADATIHLSGTGETRPSPRWDLSVRGEGIVLDEELRRSLPDAVRSFVDAVQLRGTLAFDCPKLLCMAVPAPAASPTSRPSRTAYELRFQPTIVLAEGSMEPGVPLASISGSARLDCHIRDGGLHALSGTIDIDSLEAANRPMQQLRASIVKPAGAAFYRIGDLRARLGGGWLVAEQIDVAVPEKGPAAYGLRLTLKDVDVRLLGGEADTGLQGRLTGHLDIAGKWGDPGSRVGRGDAQIQGERLYQIPAMFGLLQIANLSLPIRKPFSEASARYTVRGPQVTFEQIEIRSPGMLMQGDAVLDFATNQVRMTFLTDNPDWPRIPLLGDFLDVARHELLQIHVTGTIEEVKIQAKSMNTFRTTVDQIFSRRTKSRR